MQQHDINSRPDSEAVHGSYVSYTIGFILSIVWTLLAYVIIANHLLSGAGAIAAISGLAVVQLITQLVFFLHIGRGPDSRWNLAAFLFMLLFLAIIVGGSLWIMYSLNYNMTMSPDEMNTYMKQQDKGGF